MNRKRSGVPVVQRRHEVDEQACFQALRLLLKRVSRPGDGEGEAHSKAITCAFTSANRSTSTGSSRMINRSNV